MAMLLKDNPPVEQTEEPLKNELCNVGPRERVARIVVGVVAGLAAFAPMPAWGHWVLGIIAVAGFVTGVIRYCPMNQLFGIDNCRKTIG